MMEDFLVGLHQNTTLWKSAFGMSQSKLMTLSFFVTTMLARCWLYSLCPTHARSDKHHFWNSGCAKRAKKGLLEFLVMLLLRFFVGLFLGYDFSLRLMRMDEI